MKSRFTIEKKMYLFVAAVVLFAALGVAALSYMISSTQMERFDKRITRDSAKNYVSLTDVEYLKRLKAVVLSDEYQQLRDKAEESDDEELVISYLKEKGLWEQYESERDRLRSYMDNITDIKYLYIVVWGDKGSKYNMYLLDGDDVAVYETGLYEEREKEMAEHDVRKKEKELGAISKKAYRDSLTGVGNKEAYTDKMAELNEGIRRGDTEFAIVMLDINMLKTINDTYGHTEGDIYIKGCCMVFCETFKHSPVYRIGGDEFVAVLTGNDYKDRAEKIEQMKKRFAETEKNMELKHWYRFSAAVGIAEFTHEDEDAETVFRRADQLMYEHKQEHKKNR